MQVAGLIARGPTLDLASPILTRWCRYGGCRLVIYTDALQFAESLTVVRAPDIATDDLFRRVLVQTDSAQAVYASSHVHDTDFKSLHTLTLAAYEISFLRNFDLKVAHVAGEQNAIAHDLSRFVHPPSNRALAHISPSIIPCRRLWGAAMKISRGEGGRHPFPSIEKLIIGTAEMSLCALEPKTRSDYARVSRQWNLFVLRIISYGARAKDWWWRAKSHRANRLRKPARQQRSRGRKLGRCVGLGYIGREYSSSRLE
ncbi:BZ3500_MvSof-1268-A1-R1_Chr10-2g02842 [Microbotryum saponariae]|uniref:BZ3500_MvSof-1268-A1-R1_Chr10-2g02842 protein n=1 Tax=Microbotryum saponariae TaxID=289078 RepID=A0A2X0N3G5_9BASI|nr:BZ3501_MvSof-1269-A2-R1_Chr10-2g02428 [Microbotryum saponariae]SDA01612.1 BZ3500_MvSof-1268-A1-R1_Chr10-2g02842 [Microbotryum saponariae]